MFISPSEHHPFFNEYSNLMERPNIVSWNDRFEIDERARSQLESRDREYLSEHSANSEGFQYISGTHMTILVTNIKCIDIYK